jgi:glutamate 5-kinase
LAGYLDVSGSFKIDHGAQRALYKGGSLLPVGLMDVEGDFERGDVVRIMNDDEQEIGRGLTAYSSEEAEKIKGCQSENIIKKLGYKNKSELIHRDNMALFQSKV